MTTKLLTLLAQGKDQASAVLGRVGGAVEGLGSIAAGAATGGLALAGAAIMAVGAAAVGTAVAIFNFSQDTDTAMSKFAAQTGTAADELGEFKDVAKDVYAAGLGESIGEVAEQMGLVFRALDETGEALEASTRRAITLADAFEIDVAESINWVSSMTKSWKIDSREAFDVITKGMQLGLDVAGDFGDTLHEYSGDFDNLGFSADQMLSILNAGLEAGAYNTDVIADGFREMGIRLMEGGDDISEVFTSMGMDFGAIQASVAAGDEVWGDYTANIIEGLLSIESEVERNAAGVAIFGTKWEDLGGDIFLAAGQATEGIEGIGGATDTAAEQLATGLGPAFEKLKRTFLTEFAPLGDMAGEVITDTLVPLLQTAAEWLGEKVPLAIGLLEEKWESYWPQARDTLVRFWTEIEPSIEKLRKFLKVVTETALPLLGEAWNDLGVGWQEIKRISQDELVPALEDLWESVGLGGTNADETTEAFGLFLGALSRIWASRILQNIKTEIQGIASIINIASSFINIFRAGLEAWDGVLRRVSDMLSWMKDRIWDCVNAFNNMRLPDWLTPGSPAPLETAILGIGQAFEKVPQLAGVGAGAVGGAGGGTGSIVYVTNHFGRDSVRSDADIQAIIDGVQRSIELQGVRGRIV